MLVGFPFCNVSWFCLHVLSICNCFLKWDTNARAKEKALGEGLEAGAQRSTTICLRTASWQCSAKPLEKVYLYIITSALRLLEIDDAMHPIYVHQLTLPKCSHNLLFEPTKITFIFLFFGIFQNRLNISVGIIPVLFQNNI